MGARATRTGVNRWNHDLGIWRTKHPDAQVAAEAEQEADRSVATLQQATPLERIAHPVVEAPSQKCFRVIRLYRTRDGLHVETIGAARDLAGAMAVSTREIGKARVLDPNGKVVSDNWQPIEARA